MSIITNPSVYSTTNNPYLYTGETQSANTAAPVSGNTETEETETPNGAVTVTLSEDVADARVRENLGLNPTGKLTLGQFSTAADAQEKIVESKLTEKMKELGIDTDIPLSLSVDSKHNIVISETFPGKSKLQKALNEDPEFELAFKQMTANREVSNYADSLTQKNISLANFMDGETSWEDLMGMARKYDSITSGPASLTSLLGWSKTESPYTYKFNPEA